MAPGALLAPDHITGVISMAHAVDIGGCYSNTSGVRAGIVPIELRCLLAQDEFEFSFDGETGTDYSAAELV